MNKVFIKTGTHQLTARLYGKADKQRLRPAYIFFSGWNPTSIPWTFVDFQAALCARKNNCICVTVFLRGMGSAGDINKLTRADFLDDALAFYDFVAAYDGVDSQAISVVGESFGSYIACLLSTKRPVQNLILRVPTDFSNDGFANTPQIRVAGNLSKDWKLQKHQSTESMALAAVNAFRGKVFLVASENDAFVPLQTINNYVAAANPENFHYFLMKHASHGLISPLRQYQFFTILSKIISSNISRI
jgi:uncharacterized protein